MTTQRSYNTDIDITQFKAMDETISNEIEEEFNSKFSTLPNEFNWSFRLISDTNEIAAKKLLMSTVKNQYLCGCCWAISSATAISDAFVIKGLVNWKPNVSYTYALSKYPQQKCIGGSARILLEDIKNGDGITSDFCVDESWCINNKKCVSNSDATEHFTAKNKEFLSTLIPSVGCYDGSKKHYVYRLDDVYSMSVTDTLKVMEVQRKIKQHIMVRGPVVGGMIIMDNFPSGDFTKTGSGIYFESGIYNPAKDVVFTFGKDSIIGSHSVVIVGWGISKNTRYENMNTDVPYWYCRNSWGKKWGENGFFKIAMYPFNKICQFEKRVRVLHNKKIKEVGGVTGFNVKQAPKLEYNKTNNKSHLKSHLSLFTTDENLIYTNGMELSLNNNNSNEKFNNSGIVILAMVLALFMFLKDILILNNT
ncbi:cathepsin B [Dasineura jujubifolia toursvirus 2a]|nr:cathepsin B [Dasineura jujubifolia toursvirus 2a]